MSHFGRWQIFLIDKKKSVFYIEWVLNDIYDLLNNIFVSEHSDQYNFRKYQEGIFVCRTDTNFQEQFFFDYQNRYGFSRSTFFGYQTDTSFVFWFWFLITKQQ